ncbi:hypothetical protein E2C01_096389 [Portunus trituberculatus]|uniref:Uncharacterized protein n=1 Tax=Portunus trituberculatus TaxID=210409 RepID=A0A5B7K2N2_PORTR|nr:hypothetical protein [Portunus trituberculatus]
MVSYGVSVGVPSAWLSVLNFSLYDLGLSQVRHTYSPRCLGAGRCDVGWHIGCAGELWGHHGDGAVH